MRLSEDRRAPLVARLRAAGCAFAEQEAEVLLETAGSADALDTLLERRLNGEPLELVVGWVEFDGLRLAVQPGVFVPRRRSALLVEEAVRYLGPGAVLVDLGCGAGGLAAAVLHRIPTVEVYAVDLDPRAVACARRNLPRHRVFCGDLYAGLPSRLRGHLTAVLANVPYVPTGAIASMPREARDYEPRLALDGGPDGLDVQRRVIAEAPRWLAPGGHLFIETGLDQLAATEAELRAADFAVRSRVEDEIGGVVVRGTLPPSEV